jgi:peptide/nickel transport system permease protein
LKGKQVLLRTLRRALSTIPVLIIISILAFLLVKLMPGDPMDMMIDTTITGYELELQREALGLNDPLPVQYIKWAGQILQGNLGYSIRTNEPVSKIIIRRIPPTLSLMGISLIISLLIAIPAGVLSAVKQYSRFDYSVTLFTLAGVSIPTFFLGLTLIYIVAVKLDLLPTGMIMTPGAPPNIVDRIRHLILPTIVLGLNGVAVYTRYMRSSMLEIIRQDYIRTARAKGTKEYRVIFVHALRNGLIPIITLLGMSLPTLFSGAVITEQVFTWPGIGKLMVDSVFARDYPVLMALILITAILVVAGNLLSDILYTLVDPRIKASAE